LVAFPPHSTFPDPETALMRLLSTLTLTAGLLAAGVATADEKFVTIKGQITMKDAPKAEVLNVTTDKAVCCKDGDILSSKLVVDEKSKGVMNVVVFLRPDSDERDAAFPQDKIHPDLAKAKPKKHVIDQPKCQFEPRIIAAREGDTLVVKNSATIPHNTNFSGNGLEFNNTIPAGKELEAPGAFKADRRPAIFKCDIHPWMEGRVRVFDHPYFAVTDKDGKFEIKDAPVGKFRVVYWHEMGFHKGRDGALGFPTDIKGDKKTMELDAISLELPK
jgi:plastocyanin